MKTVSSSSLVYRLYHVSNSHLRLSRLSPSLISFRSGRYTYSHRTFCKLTKFCYEQIFPQDSRLSSPSISDNAYLDSSNLSQTLTEKIVQRHSLGVAKGKLLKSGDYVTIRPRYCMTHDNSWPVALKFMSIGATKIYDPNQIVMTLDHDVQNKSEENLRKYQQIKNFAEKHGTNFYPAGEGIGHQIMVEKGYAWPCTMTVASDSHSNMYGGIGCLGTAIVRTDAASIWATGKTWWQIPPVAKVIFTGLMPKGVTGKDVIIALCGLFNNSEVLNHAIEFTGSDETMRSLSVDDRLTIANMTTEWGGLTGLFPIDSVLLSWLRAKATTAALFGKEGSTRITHSKIEELIQNQLAADKKATYAKILYLNLSTLSPYVSGPNSVKIATPLRNLEMKNIKLNKAYLVSCTNARLSDFAAAAKVFKEASKKSAKTAKVSPGVELYIAAASKSEQELAEDTGDWQTLLDAGAKPLPSGCGPCIGLGVGLLRPGEVGISASNRNFKGRMGSTDARAYLASPEVVAASALKGEICGPGWYEKPLGVDKVIIGEGHGNLEADKASCVEEALSKVLADVESIVDTAEGELLNVKAGNLNQDSEEDVLAQILPGFPVKIEGEILFCDADNINTDGIYPGKYTYQDNTSEKMAEVCMQNFDPSFGRIVREGDILVSGFNFGCGSSREQAATAILANKIPMIICGSLGSIFARNCINNALMGIESERLVRRLREHFGQGKERVLTRRTGWRVCWDVRRSNLIVTEDDGKVWSQPVGVLTRNVQEIIACGGLEKWVKAML